MASRVAFLAMIAVVASATSATVAASPAEMQIGYGPVNARTGFSFTPAQIRVKMQKLTSHYPNLHSRICSCWRSWRTTC